MNADRTALNARLQASARDVAAAVTTRFLAAHPDWVTRYGDRARAHGEADALFHIEFLAGAIVADAPEAFADYGRWSARVLQARGMPPGFLCEFFDLIADRFRELLQPEEAAVTGAYLVAARTAAAATSPADPPALSETATIFRQAILSGRRDTAVSILTATMAAGGTIADVADLVVGAAMRQLGEMWQDAVITVADEHRATAMAQFAMIAVHAATRRPTSAGKALVSGVEGERHQIGGYLVSEVLVAAGWDVAFLGTDLPHRDVVRMAGDHGPRLIAISATLTRSLPAVLDLTASLRSATAPGTRIVVGGRAFRGVPDPASAVGADAWFPDTRSLEAWLPAAG